jgi:hypothetical protein
MSNRSDAGRAFADWRRQRATAAMMIRPAAFGWNAETQDSNRFQSPAAPADPALAQTAVAEFDAMVAVLRGAGVAIHALDDRPELRCPDAVFPNNWVSFHDDGTVVLYPMLAPTRRRERRPELLQELIARGGYVVSRLIDLTHHELENRFLEGTGSLVLDHVGRIAYACPSPRTHPAVLREFCDELGYEPCTFDARGRDGTPIYHTNVLLAIGGRCAVICTDAVAADDRARVLDRLAQGGRAVIEIGFEQLESFAGNVLELQAADGAGVLVMSAQARAGLAAGDFDALMACVDRVVVPEVARIEQAGGGSVRCMLAEVFLPARPGEARKPA